MPDAATVWEYRRHPAGSTGLSASATGEVVQIGGTPGDVEPSRINCRLPPLGIGPVELAPLAIGKPSGPFLKLSLPHRQFAKCRQYGCHALGLPAHDNPSVRCSTASARAWRAGKGIRSLPAPLIITALPQPFVANAIHFDLLPNLYAM